MRLSKVVVVGSRDERGGAGDDGRTYIVLLTRDKPFNFRRVTSD